MSDIAHRILLECGEELLRIRGEVVDSQIRAAIMARLESKAIMYAELHKADRSLIR